MFLWFWFLREVFGFFSLDCWYSEGKVRMRSLIIYLGDLKLRVFQDSRPGADKLDNNMKTMQKKKNNASLLFLFYIPV
mgnify:CR=1 FL=1